MKHNYFDKILISSSLALTALPLFADDIIHFGFPIHTETAEMMKTIQADLAAQNGNAFLYVLRPDSGNVWSYTTSGPGQIVLYTISNGTTVKIDSIPYPKSTDWVGSFSEKISMLLASYWRVFDPNSLTCLLDSGNTRLVFFTLHTPNNFPEMSVLISEDSLGDKQRYTNMFNQAKQYWPLNTYNDLTDSLPEDTFFPNLAEDIRRYIYPNWFQNNK